MSHILVVGKKFTPFIEKLVSLGHTYTLLQDKDATRYPAKKLPRRVVADFANKESLLGAVDAIARPIDGVITIYENYILPTAWIAEHLGLAGMPVEAAEACTDKFIMRSLFAKAPEKISPHFAIITNKDDLKKFAKNHSFPLILKPTNLAKSLLVTKNSSLDELMENYERSSGLLESSYKKYAPHRTPNLLVEEFIEGTAHSVDAFVDTLGTPHVLEQVVDYQTGYDIGYDDNFHYSRMLPSRLSANDQAAVRHCAEVGIRALGMRSSPAHVEIIMTKNGPQIVEIGARNGGYRERMHRLANGIDIIGAAISLALGKLPNIRATKNESCAVFELFPKKPGSFKGIASLETLQGLASLRYLSIKVQEGEFIGKSADGYKMAAIIILHHSDVAQFASDLKFVNDNVFVKTC